LEVEHTHKGSLAIEDMKLDKKVLRELRRALQERRETPSMGTRSTIESKARLISSTPIPDEDDDSDDRLDEDEEEEPLDNDEEELDTDDEPEDEEDE
jgi:DNA-binding NtrC family response regulator